MRQQINWPALATVGMMSLVILGVFKPIIALVIVGCLMTIWTVMAILVLIGEAIGVCEIAGDSIHTGWYFKWHGFKQEK